MKLVRISKIISIICSVITFILSSMGLIIGVQSIGAPGFEGLGVIFIIPSVIVMIVILFDFLITLDIFKKGLIYSFLNSLIKIIIIILCIPSTISDFKYQMKFGTSNLDFDIILIVLLIMVTIPSILNIIKLIKTKKL